MPHTHGIDVTIHVTLLWHQLPAGSIIILFWPVDLSIRIIWMSPFQVLGVSGVCFIFTVFSIDWNLCKQTVKTLIRCNILSHLNWVYTVCISTLKWVSGLNRWYTCMLKFTWESNSLSLVARVAVFSFSRLFDPRGLWRYRSPETHMAKQRKQNQCIWQHMFFTFFTWCKRKKKRYFDAIWFGLWFIDT